VRGRWYLARRPGKKPGRGKKKKAHGHRYGKLTRARKGETTNAEANIKKAQEETATMERVPKYRVGALRDLLFPEKDIRLEGPNGRRKEKIKVLEHAENKTTHRKKKRLTAKGKKKERPRIDVAAR